MLFTPFRPMGPVLAKTVPVGPKLLYQMKWDGVRIIAHVGGGKLMLHNRQLRMRTDHYPELSCLGELLEDEAIFDGELVALKDGRPSFSLVLERDLITPASGLPEDARVRRLMQKVPVNYMVFDLVWFKGENLMSRSLRERQAILGEILPETDHVHLVESFTDGEALFAAVSEKKLEGIVAKEADAPYYPGRKHPAWKKVKVRQKQLVAIGGYTVKDGRINALLAGAYRYGRFVYLGRVATGLSGNDLVHLSPFLQASVRKTPPFANATGGRGKVWVEPKLVALVDFQEWTEDLRMRQPVIKGFTRNEPDDCILG
ncbi:MAG: non-homologous end-joining DNA ligase [Bacillota bacterium]|nr:non-homologous end-joining DNA ligase [Bacillota bacterium]